VVNKLFKVVISRSARKRLKDVHDDYKTRSASPKVAKKVKDGLISEAKKLESLPASNPKLPIKKEVDPPFRYAKKWSFKIIFQIFQKKSTVRVIDFMHDKENPEKWEDL